MRRPPRPARRFPPVVSRTTSAALQTGQRTGIPKTICKDGFNGSEPLVETDLIRDTLQNGDTVYVTSSLGGDEPAASSSGADGAKLEE